MFALDAVNAGKGDALVVRWGKQPRPRLLVVDGGPARTWSDNLSPHLREVGGLDPAAPRSHLDLALVVVSHVDADHITGVIDMMRDVDQGLPDLAPFRVAEVWHNAFSDSDLFGEVPRQVAVEASFDSGAFTSRRASSATALAASIPQGSTLAEYIENLGVPRNESFSDRLVIARPDSASIDVDGLRVQVVCPNEDMLSKLRAAWKAARKKELTERLNAAEARRVLAAAFDDASVPNQSSIVLLLSHAKRTMLLTGDVRGDHLLTGLANVGLLDDGHLKVDLFKVPHHGSLHSNSPELFDQVKARHYVLSGNGQHGNPHPEVLTMILESRTGKQKITLWLTNRPGVGASNVKDRAKARNAQAVLDQAEADEFVTVRYRNEQDYAVTVELA